MKPGEFKRGFKHFTKHIDGKEKYIASCTSCADWDDKEGCQNPNVLAYDMIDEDNRTYCNYWRTGRRENSYE